MKTLIAASCALALAVPAYADQAVDDEAPPMEECPLAFRGANVRVEKVPGGVKLEFRNGNKGFVEQMREQLRSIGEMVEQHGTERQTSGDDEEVEFPPVDVEVKDIVLGARVTVRASRLSDLPKIRDIAFGFAEFWKTSPCNEPLVSMR